MDALSQSSVSHPYTSLFDVLAHHSWPNGIAGSSDGVPVVNAVREDVEDAGSTDGEGGTDGDSDTT